MTTFAINRMWLAATATGGGDLEKPLDVTFGKQNEMFIIHFELFKPPGTKIYAVPNTGVNWRVTKL